MENRIGACKRTHFVGERRSNSGLKPKKGNGLLIFDIWSTFLPHPLSGSFIQNPVFFFDRTFKTKGDI